MMRETELYKACNILFGSDVDVSFDFLQYIQPSGIKSAYRKLARLTHPDHAAGGVEDAGAERFIEANWAYESLNAFITHRDRRAVRGMFRGAGRDTVRRPASRRRRRKYSRTAQGRPRGNYYNGVMPLRKLMFGEFLFYSGEVSWEALIKAIVWQRGQRPRLGDMASRWGWLSGEDVIQVLRSRMHGESIGHALVRLGICSSLQVRALLRTQRKQQKPFGEFFITNGYIARSHLNLVLYKKFLKHNSAFE
ncbi:MAG: J domain-containing protein [Thermodesulfovibrionales bacterium]|nr:J domain-containing protein [Thermodesulfovibrionales bacterium]